MNISEPLEVRITSQTGSGGSSFGVFQGEPGPLGPTGAAGEDGQRVRAPTSAERAASRLRFTAGNGVFGEVEASSSISWAPAAAANWGGGGGGRGRGGGGALLFDLSSPLK